jgi:hypothetical protein
MRVITHHIRKSGRRDMTPVNDVHHGDQVYCAPGFGATPDWYRNLLKEPTAGRPSHGRDVHRVDQAMSPRR